VKIAIVNDMRLAAEALRRAVSLDPRHQVIWTASDGNEALAFCAAQKPDLILMDLIMPNMGGVEATRQIMSRHPCPILLVTADVGANANLVFEAMACGALDAIDTPHVEGKDPREDAAPLLKKINDIEKRIHAEQPAVRDGERGPASCSMQPAGLVAIGASAGGPGALATVLAGLPKTFRAAIVIVQHIDVMFANGMAEWLHQHSAIPVRLAREGDRLEAGVALLAGAGGHLVLKDAHRVGYVSEPRENIYKPSIDVFFSSVCKYWAGNAVGVVLTGMGADGALGLKSLRDKGCYTIAQDEATSMVYGMPKAAATLGAVVDIVPVGGIASKLAGAFAR
jgi:two-component system chemotaxis response regulator CheB/two-component system response regulator WspF